MGLRKASSKLAFRKRRSSGEICMDRPDADCPCFDYRQSFHRSVPVATLCGQQMVEMVPPRDDACEYHLCHSSTDHDFRPMYTRHRPLGPTNRTLLESENSA